MSHRIYLDNNSSTAIDPRVCNLLLEYTKDLIGNPSSSHFFGQKTRASITKSRDLIAAYLKVKPSEIIFTSGGTESANTMLRGIMSLHPSAHLITSTVEHACVYSSAKQLEKNGTQVSFLKPGLWGSIQPETVLNAIQTNTKLIALMAVNNETGVKTDIEAIANIAEKHQIPLFVDGVCLLGKEIFSIPKGVSAMCFSGHKLHSPAGIGFTFIRSGLKFQSLLVGGEQEFGRRAGTQNVLGIIALGKAIEILVDDLPLASKQMLFLRDKFEQTLMKNIKGISINGSGPRTVNTSNLAFANIDGESLLIALDAAGIAASHGSACASGSMEPSRVLLEMGIPLELARSSIRFSLSRFTTEKEIDEAIDIITSLVTRQRRL